MCVVSLSAWWRGRCSVGPGTWHSEHLRESQPVSTGSPGPGEWRTQLITNTTGTQEPDTARPPDSASGEPRDVTPGWWPHIGWSEAPGADQAPMCAQVCANQMLADTAPGPSLPLRRCKQPFLGHISQHQRDSSGVWHFYARPWCQCSFVINAQLTLAALVWMKSCLDPPDPGPSHCLLYPANMIIYTGPCQDHGVEENTISVPAMMARQLAAKQGSDAGFESLKSHRGVDCKRLRGVVWGIPWDLIQASSANKYPAFDSELRPHLSWRQLMRPARPGTSVNLYRVRHIINLSFL